MLIFQKMDRHDSCGYEIQKSRSHSLSSEDEGYSSGSSDSSNNQNSRSSSSPKSILVHHSKFDSPPDRSSFDNERHVHWNFPKNARIPEALDSSECSSSPPKVAT